MPSITVALLCHGIQAVQWIMTSITYLSQIKNLLWYFIILLAVYTKRVYGFSMVNQAVMPIAAHPSAWIPNGLTFQNLGTLSWNHTTTATTDSSTPDTTPIYPNPPMESPTNITILIAVGFLITLIAGVTALFHSLLRHTSPSPGQPEHGDQGEGEEHDDQEEEEGHGDQGEEEDPQPNDESRKVNTKKALRKAAHLRSPMERLLVDIWSSQHAPSRL